MFLAGLLKASKRRYVQISALILSNAYFLSSLNFIPCGYLQCSNCALSTFACPLILVQRGVVMASMGMLGMMSAKIVGSVTAALAMLLLFGAVFGSWGCGWLCPFGFLQDLLGKAPLPKFKLPGWSGHLRLPLFVILVVAIPYYTGSLFFCDICPPGTINRLWQQAAGIPLFFKTPEGVLALVGHLVLATVVFLALFTHRPFCGLLCPIGGVHGILNKVSGFFLKVDEEKCVACNRCTKACPQGINPSENPSHTQCSRCFECTKVCDHINIDINL